MCFWMCTISSLHCLTFEEMLLCTVAVIYSFTSRVHHELNTGVALAILHFFLTKVALNSSPFFSTSRTTPPPTAPPATRTSRPPTSSSSPPAPTRPPVTPTSRPPPPTPSPSTSKFLHPKKLFEEQITKKKHLAGHGA